MTKEAKQETRASVTCSSERVMPGGRGLPIRCWGRHTMRNGDRGEVCFDGCTAARVVLP